MSRVRWVVLAVCVLSVGAASAFAGWRGANLASGDWQVLVENVPEKARDIFISQARTLSYNDAHALAHVFGEAVYGAHGIAGIAYCTDDFAYGCFHAAAGAAYAELGEDATDELKVACANSGMPYTCIHGIGHGVLAHVGEQHIAEAFAMCDPFNDGSSAVGGCWGGVMMEYNFRTMQSPDGVDVRPLRASESRGPCETLQARHRAACYYELPSWWRASQLMEDPQSSWKSAGDLCEELPPDGRGTCYRGIGNVAAPQEGYNIAYMEEACGQMGSTQARDLCLGEALGHMLGQRDRFGDLKAYCGREDALRSFCGQHADAF